LKAQAGLWLYAAPERDVAGYPFDFHAPVHRAAPDIQSRARRWLRLAAGCPVVLDALCVDQDAEYREVRALENGG
jgi:hypothetical protein